MNQRRTARELTRAIEEWLQAFDEIPETSPVRKAPLNRSTRPLPGTDIPEEWRELVSHWICQDLLFDLLRELKDAATRYRWKQFSLAFEVRGLRGYELTAELLKYRDKLEQIIAETSWYQFIWHQLRQLVKGKPNESEE
jgi:hypothetical protein